jgi:hypothetical protein
VIVTDIVLSDDDVDADVGHPMGRTDSLGQAEPSTGHVPADDDVEVLGKTSAPTINPNPIVAVREEQQCLLPPIRPKSHLPQVFKDGSVHTSS